MTDRQIAELGELRRALHQTPEVSGEEKQTAARIAMELERAGADRIWTRLGGHGVAAEFIGKQDGPTVMIRCELDGLPIHEISEVPHRSTIAGKGHLCGHDGHMVMVLGVGLALAKRPEYGRVVVLFQPAEETGAGAQAVINDPRWPEIRPDFAFAYHNIPGRPLGEIGLCEGPSNCASRGMKITFTGKTSHAAAPEDGDSPAQVMAGLMQTLPLLGNGGTMDDDFALATLTHSRLGKASFGIAPGDGELWVTLRSQTDGRMDRMVAEAETLVSTALGQESALLAAVSWHDVFLANVNEANAAAIAARSAQNLDLTKHLMTAPMRWSEDFSRFGLDGAKSAMLFIGSGEDQPQLHNPNFDFPDALIPVGISLFVEIIEQILSNPALPAQTGRPAADG
ncbi:amidohydrolase [Parasedimentitalea psychrophila]|uniref:Amidohydrolase n=1 Tax=Parasedimentitalea psychrophila TaxID=2997337 RepID=A0A9Y2L038_9RHOB|nr:amidohydrolase [Parasedimentitalea psychrophila]WIY25703.1 amidohydrolase [Parasedimentitalea psychrophila]